MNIPLTAAELFAAIYAGGLLITLSVLRCVEYFREKRAGCN